jgi:hypothetical protein
VGKSKRITKAESTEARAEDEGRNRKREGEEAMKSRGVEAEAG